VSYDRNTGRPRGFGFVVFADPVIADKVVLQQHTIDRREVEAKKALPKEESPVSKDQQAAASGQRTKKIFVGGLAPTVDEAAMRAYFDDFGVVEDAVVMYDHDNRRPRGFGFITFAEEDSVDKVFGRGSIQVIHEKQIEIKRAVPRDSMPPSPRSAYRGPPPPYHDGRSPYSERGHGGRGGGGGYRGGGGGGGGGGYASPHHAGYGGGSMRTTMSVNGAMYSSPPPAVVTGIPANLPTPVVSADPAAGLPAAGMTTPIVGMQSPIAMAQSMQSPTQLVAGYSLQNGMQAAAAAAAAAAQLPAASPAGGYSLEAQQAAAARELADVQQQLALTSVSGALEQLQQQQAAVQQAQQHQQQQQAAQQAQQQAQATIWS
jgi:hypothetical protein